MSKEPTNILTRREFLRLVTMSGGALISSRFYHPDLFEISMPESNKNLSIADDTEGSDEFVGPFSNWINVKSEYGAIGDGISDDTNAIQSAFNLLKSQSLRKVVYFPAGIYRITQTLEVSGESGLSCLGIGLIGEHPDTTIFRWDGASGGIMLDYSAWYSRIGRVTFDGVGKAGTILRHGYNFSTNNEICDTIFQDAEFGIEVGHNDGQGIAETTVRRCQFLHCDKAGVSLQNWNSLDWWFWYCLFEDCYYGVTNLFGSGNFHIYESVFRRSRSIDIAIGNLDPFSFRNNYSSGSNSFLYAGNMVSGALITLQGNTVVDTIVSTPIYIGSLGPVLILDNIIKNDGFAWAVLNFGWRDGDFISIGNTYTTANPVQVSGRLLTFDDRIVSPSEVTPTEPKLPNTPQNMNRQIFEVPVNADASAIQEIINNAAQLIGKRPIVHFPASDYSIDRTIEIPANCDVQLVGDGIQNATTLNWVGQENHPVLHMRGPCIASLREMAINGNSVGIIIDNCDQISGSVLMDGSSIGGARQVALLIDQLKHTETSLFGFGYGSNKVGMKVVGAGENSENQGNVTIFCGTSSSNDNSFEVTDGARLIVRDTWNECGEKPLFFQATGRGEIIIHGAYISMNADETIPAIDINDFHGKVALITSYIQSCNSNPGRVLIRGQGSDTNVLSLGVLMDRKGLLVNESPNAITGLVNSQYLVSDGTLLIPDYGNTDPIFIRDMLSLTRKARPQLLNPLHSGVTDARFYRVAIGCEQIGMMITSQIVTDNIIEYIKVPHQIRLFQNYPNPFNPTTVIRYQLSEYSEVQLKVFNLLGKEVSTLVNERQQAGNYRVSFDGGNLPSGVYFYKLKTRRFEKVKKMILAK